MRELQRFIQNILTFQDSLDHLPQEIQDHPHMELIQSYLGSQKLRGLEVYQDGYFTRLGDALSEDFPSVLEALGEERFAVLGMEYLNQHPSQSFTLGDIGQSFIPFLEKHRFTIERPELLDLAELDQAVTRTFYSPYTPPFETSGLDKASEEQWIRAHVILDSSVTILQSKWNLAAFWNHRNHENHLTRLIPEESIALIYRQEDGQGGFPVVTTLTPLQGLFIANLKTGVSLGDCCKIVQEVLTEEMETQPIMDWFTTWVKAGVIRNVEFD